MVIELRKSTSRVQENLLKESEIEGYNDDNSGVKLEDDDDWVWDNDDDGVEEINIEISFFSSARRSPLCSDGLRVTCANRALLALKLSTFINYFCFSFFRPFVVRCCIFVTCFCIFSDLRVTRSPPFYFYFFFLICAIGLLFFFIFVRLLWISCHSFSIFLFI